MSTIDNSLIDAFKREVSDVVDSYEDERNGKAVDLLDEADFHSLTIGWAMARGLNPSDAFDFANHIRYHTDLA
jgi:hypothetical protein